MRQVLTIFFSFFLFSSIFSQTITDFYFKNPLPTQCKELKKIPTAYWGEWQSNKDTLRSFLISENKIYAQYKHLIILSKSEMKEAGYQFKDGFLFGFSKMDSLPAMLKNDTILFCYINNHLMIQLDEASSVSIIGEVNGGLILSKKEDSLYRYALLTVKKNELVVSEVDHETELEDILKLSEIESIRNEENEIILYQADFNKKQMEKFISSGYFNVSQSCQRIKHK